MFLDSVGFFALYFLAKFSSEMSGKILFFLAAVLYLLHQCLIHRQKCCWWTFLSECESFLLRNHIDWKLIQFDQLFPMLYSRFVLQASNYLHIYLCAQYDWLLATLLQIVLQFLLVLFLIGLHWALLHKSKFWLIFPQEVFFGQAHSTICTFGNSNDLLFIHLFDFSMKWHFVSEPSYDNISQLVHIALSLSKYIA